MSTPQAKPAAPKKAPLEQKKQDAPAPTKTSANASASTPSSTAGALTVKQSVQSTPSALTFLVGGGAGKNSNMQVGAYQPKSSLANIFSKLVHDAGAAERQRQSTVNKTMTAQVIKAAQSRPDSDHVIAARCDISAVTSDDRVPLTVLMPNVPYAGQTELQQRNTIIYSPIPKMTYMSEREKRTIMMAGDVNNPFHLSPWSQFTFLWYALVEDHVAAINAGNKSVVNSAPVRLTRSKFWKDIDPIKKRLIVLGNVNLNYGPPPTGTGIQCTSRPYKPAEGTGKVVALALSNESVFKLVCEYIFLFGLIPKTAQMAAAHCDHPDSVDPWELQPELGEIARHFGLHTRESAFGRAVHGSYSINPKYPARETLDGKPRPAYLFPDKTSSGFGTAHLIREINVVPPAIFVSDESSEMHSTLPQPDVLAWFKFSDQRTYEVLHKVNNVQRFNEAVSDTERFTTEISTAQWGQTVCLSVVPHYEETIMRFQDAAIAHIDALKEKKQQEAGEAPLSNDQLDQIEMEGRLSYHIPVIASYLPAPELPEIITREFNERNQQVAKNASMKRRFQKQTWIASTNSKPADNEAGLADTSDNSANADAASTTTANAASAPAAAAAGASSFSSNEPENVTRTFIQYDWVIKAFSSQGPLIYPTYRWVRAAPDPEDPERMSYEFVVGTPGENDVKMQFIDFDLSGLVQFFKINIERDHLEHFGLAQTDTALPPRLLSALVQRSLIVIEGTTSSKTEAAKAHKYFEAMFPDKEDVKRRFSAVQIQLMNRVASVNGLVADLLAIYKEKNIIRIPIIESTSGQMQIPDDLANLASEFTAVSIHPSRCDDFGGIWANKVLFDIALNLPSIAVEITPQTAQYFETRVVPTSSRFGVGSRKIQRNAVLINSTVSESGTGGQVAELAKSKKWKFYLLSMDIVQQDLAFYHGNTNPEIWDHVFCRDYFEMDMNTTLMDYFKGRGLTNVPAILVNNRVSVNQDGVTKNFLLYAISAADKDQVSAFIDNYELKRFITGEPTRGKPRRRVLMPAPSAETPQITNNTGDAAAAPAPAPAPTSGNSGAATATNTDTGNSTIQSAIEDDMDVVEDEPVVANAGPVIEDVPADSAHLNSAAAAAAEDEGKRQKSAKRPNAEITPDVETNVDAGTENAAAAEEKVTAPSAPKKQKVATAASPAPAAPGSVKKPAAAPAKAAAASGATTAKPAASSKVAPKKPAPKISEDGEDDEELVTYVPKAKSK